MNNIINDIERITQRFQDQDFLANKGMSNEVGIHVYCYDPADEMIMQAGIEQLKNNAAGYRLIVHDVYQLMLQILEERRIVQPIIKLEERQGKNKVIQEVSKVITAERLIEKMTPSAHQPGDIVCLKGFGHIYPFMRAHALLASMQKYYPNTPIVAFYPGSYDGQSLNLFNRFFDGHYYRAFSLL